MPRPRVSDPAWEKSNFRTVSKKNSARSEFNDGTHALWSSNRRLNDVLIDYGCGGCFFLFTRAPLYFLSTRYHCNCSRIFLSIRRYTRKLVLHTFEGGGSHGVVSRKLPFLVYLLMLREILEQLTWYLVLRKYRGLE